MLLSFAPAVAINDDHVYVCQARKCTRFMVPWLPEAYPAEEQDRWLIAPYRYDLSVIIVRCPQHISETALLRTIGFNRATRDWAERVKIEDEPTNQKWSPVTPYPVDPRLLWSSDGHLSFKVRKRAIMAAIDARRIAGPSGE